MKNEPVVRLAVFAGLISAGAFMRIYFRELPNFAPIAAMALFSGYYFRSAWVAALVPLLAMSLSDLFIGGYEWQTMMVVYGALTLPVACRGWLRKYLAIERGSARSTIVGLGGLLSFSLASSLLFYLTTNFACWCFGTMYEQTWQGLLLSYQQAIPFFRNTLTGDLFFGASLFGSYALAINLGWAQGVKPVPAASA